MTGHPLTGAPQHLATSAPRGKGEPARLLFVHAHPDDETLSTGVAMAHYAAAGHEVHLLTCTLGEEGEVIPRELRQLAADRQDRLGAYRLEELHRAMAIVGATHHVLGQDPATGSGSAFRDSGMAGTPSGQRPGCFARAVVAQAAALVAEHLQQLRPHVVVTYDRHGGYLHPDHVQTHRVTLAAVRALPSAERPEVFAVVTPMSWAREDRSWLASDGEVARHTELVVPEASWPHPPSVVEDHIVTHVVLDEAARDTQARALAEHRTQVMVFDGFYALSNRVVARLSGREAYVRLDPDTGDAMPRREVEARADSAGAASDGAASAGVAAAAVASAGDGADGLLSLPDLLAVAG